MAVILNRTTSALTRWASGAMDSPLQGSPNGLRVPDWNARETLKT